MRPGDWQGDSTLPVSHQAQRHHGHGPCGAGVAGSLSRLNVEIKQPYMKKLSFLLSLHVGKRLESGASVPLSQC